MLCGGKHCKADPICTATAVGPRVMLTAAHCLMKYRKDNPEKRIRLAD